MNATYRSRRDAGRRLAVPLQEQIRAREPVVLALPRGGVPVGLEVARALHAPLDVFVVRKFGGPAQPERAIGAISGSGFEVLDRAAIRELGLSHFQIAAVADREMEELHRREACYRARRAPLSVRGRTLVLVDDGVASGLTLRAAVGALRLHDPARIIVAVPVGATAACGALEADVDALVCPWLVEGLHAVRLYYEDPGPTTDEEVRRCLDEAEADALVTGARPHFSPTSRSFEP